MTLGLVDDGETIGTPFSWQIGAPTSDNPDATSPSTATTPSRVISRVTADPGFAGLALVVVGDHFDRLAVDAAGRIVFFDRQANAVVGRAAKGGFGAGHRSVVADQNLVAARFRPATDQPATRTKPNPNNQQFA